MSDAATIPTAARPTADTLQRLWGYVKTELLFLVWAFMDVALIAPFGLLLMPWARYWPTGQTALWLLLMVLIPFNLLRFMTAVQLRRSRQRLVMVAGLLLAILLSWRLLLFAPRPFFDLGWLGALFVQLGDGGAAAWPRALTLFLLLLLCWWRGMALVRLNADIGAVGLRLRLGALLLAGVALIAAGVREPWNVLPFILLYYLAGLTAASLIRAEQIEREQSGLAASVTPGWLGTIFATSLLVVATAGLFAAILSGQAAFLLARWLSPLWTAVLALAAVVIATIGYLAQPFIYVFALLIDFLAALIRNAVTVVLNFVGEDAIPTLEPLQPLPTPGAEELVTVAGPPNINVRLIIIVLMIVAVVVVVFFLTRLYREAVIAAREREFVRPGAGRGSVRPNLGERLLQRLGLLRNWRAAASVRRIYQQMCAAAAGAGFPRAEAETPYEYLKTLREVWPEHTADSRLITEAYVKVRYGEVPETEAELNEIKAAWQRLEDTPPVAFEA